MRDIQALLPADDTILALDLETKGTDFSDPDSAIVGIGLADRNGCFYLDWCGIDDPAREYLFGELRRRPLTSFNVLFDGGFLWAKADLGWLNWSMCSFGLFRQLATEGHDGQTWKLDTLIRDVLGWPVSNKDALASLLAKHGLAKSDMWKLSTLEPEGFGYYCALDSEAHLQAFEALADAVAGLGQPGAVVREYHTTDFLTEVRLLIEQQLRGIQIDVPKLQAYRDKLQAEIDAGTKDFLNHPEVAPIVAEYNAAVVQELSGREPAKWTSKHQVSKNWEKWAARVEQARVTNYFNPGSPQQLQWLFYDKLGYPVKKWTNKERTSRSTDKEVLPFLGPAGRLLSQTKKKMTELGQVTGCLEVQRNGVLHPEMKSVGTLTGRISGGHDDG